MGPGAGLDGSCLGNSQESGHAWYTLFGVSIDHCFRKKSQISKTWESKNSERNFSTGGSWLPLSCIFIFPGKSFSFIFAITAMLGPKRGINVMVQPSTKPLSLEIFVEQEVPVSVYLNIFATWLMSNNEMLTPGSHYTCNFHFHCLPDLFLVYRYISIHPVSVTPFMVVLVRVG